MLKKPLADGTVHKMPADLKKALTTNTKASMLWQNVITPLGRNEWICWVENAKMLDTRKKRIGRTVTEINEGKRRPCCWIGCIHRQDKEISPSIKWVLSRQKSKK